MSCVGTDSPCWIAGDDIYYDLQYTQSDGTPYDISTATAKMDLRDAVTDIAVVKSMNGGITDGANGFMRFTLTDVESAAILPRAEASRTYVFSVKLTYADATEQTIMSGTATLEQVATE